MLDKRSQILIATFSPWKNGKRSPTNGMIEPFIQYFSKRYDNFILIDQPHPGSDIVLPRVEFYRNGKLKKISKPSLLVSLLSPILWLTNSHKTQISFKVRDFLSVVDTAIKIHKTTDLFIGFESINALAGITLRKIGLAKTVVYYVSDFSPKRYKSKWFNNFYLWLDKLATYHANATWNVSPAMPEARKKLGYDEEKISPQIIAPNAFFKKEIKSLPFAKTIPYSIIYAGTLGLENGPDLAIETFGKIIQKFPTATLTIAGRGSLSEESFLKNLIEKLSLTKNVNFVGFVPTNRELYELIRKHWLSIAPYKSIPESVRKYADAVKIRASLACGVPTVTTQVPPNGKVIRDAGAGIVTTDKPNELANAVIKIFTDKNLLEKMRSNAINSAKENTWENSYTNALRKMKLIS